MGYIKERWYHVYLYLITVTGVLSLVVAALSDWTTAPFILAFGIMSIASLVGFLTEFMIMGFTAKAGGFFWSFVTCGVVVHFLPY